jgi:hypothetical protein
LASSQFFELASSQFFELASPNTLRLPRNFQKPNVIDYNLMSSSMAACLRNCGAEAYREPAFAPSRWARFGKPAASAKADARR